MYSCGLCFFSPHLFLKFDLICFSYSISRSPCYMFSVVSLSSSVSLSLRRGYFSCHALIGTLTHQCLSPKINTMDFLYVFVSWHINHSLVTLHFIVPLDDVWSRQHVFANNLDSFQGLCFYCFMLSSIFCVFKEHVWHHIM